MNIKKISAVVGSILMTGMTMGVAAAAAFPSDFTSELPAVVHGGADADDLVAAQSIVDYLKPKVPTTGGDVSGGDSVKFEKTSTKFHLGNGVKDVVSTSITYDSPGTGLPTLLADGTFVDDDNDEFEYTQKIDVSNWSLTMFEDSEYKEDEPGIAMKISSGANVLNYTFEFTDEPQWGDLATSDLDLMGKEYHILSITENTTLNLLESASSATVQEGETKTVEGREVSINYISTTEVVLDVDGELTNSLDETSATTYKLDDGTYIGIKDIRARDVAGSIGSVEFSIGKGKLKLVSGSDVELNDDAVSDVVATFTNSADSSGSTLQKIVIKWDADEDLFIGPTSEPIMPGFEVIKMTFGGMVYATEEVISVEAGSNTYIQLNDFPLKTSTEDINILYTENSSNYGGIGKDSDNLLLTSPKGEAIFNESIHDYFVVSWNDGNDAESYLMKAGNFKTENNVNKTTFSYKNDDVWTILKADAKAADTLTMGNIELTVNQIVKDDKTVNVTAGTNVDFHTLYSKEGMKVFLPFSRAVAADLGHSVGGINFSTNDSDRRFALIFSEEDKNGNKGAGSNITAILDFNTATTPEVSVETVGNASVTREKIGESDKYLSYTYGALATEILEDESGDKESVTLTYHGDESYGEIYLNAPEVTIGETGAMLFKDSDTGWDTKNVIIVGGSCINSAAATALGVADGTCSEAFTSATGVGAGQYLIKSVADKFTTGKIALVVAGYEKADTAAAASYLVNQPSEIDTTAGNEYLGIVGATGGSTVTKV